MAKDIIKNIPLTLDINARKRLNEAVDINLYSKDIATGQFEFTFIDEDGKLVELDETYSAQALVRYEGNSKTYLDDMAIEGNIIRFIFPHDFIIKDGTIKMYIYVTKDNYTSDVAAISFPVFVSEIDKELDRSVAVHYIGQIEKLIQDMKDEMSSYQVDVDEIIEGYEESISKLQALETNYEPQLQALSTQLAQKANQAFVDAQLSTIVSGAPKGTYTDLAALQSAYPNGAEGIFLVLQNGHWYYWNSVSSTWTDGGVYQGTGIADNAIRPSMLYDPNFIKRESVNRFDKTTALQGYATSPTGKSASANWYTTDYYIPVKPGDVIRANPAYGGTIYSYDSNYIYITNRSPTTNNEPISYTIPPMGGFIKFNVFKDNFNTFMYTINAPLPDIYEPFVASDVITVDWLDINNNSVTPSKLPPETIAFLQDELNPQTLTNKWRNKKMITAGTSISYQDGKPYAQGPQQGQIAKGWQTHVKEQLGLASVTNIALSGRPMADGSANGTGMITGILARTDYINYDLCVIEEGTNDAKLNVPAGVIKTPGSSDFDRTTFCGSMQMGIEHIKLHNPNITIALFTPLHRNNGGLNSFDSVNSVGLKLSDYRDLILKIGALYGCKVVDMFAESGISMITLAIDTIDGLHPNDGGYLKQGNTAAIGINNA